MYIIGLVDGEEVWGTYFGICRGFWLIESKGVLIPIRPSSAAVLTECG